MENYSKLYGKVKNLEIELIKKDIWHKAEIEKMVLMFEKEEKKLEKELDNIALFSFLFGFLLTLLFFALFS